MFCGVVAIGFLNPITYSLLYWSRQVTSQQHFQVSFNVYILRLHARVSRRPPSAPRPRNSPRPRPRGACGRQDPEGTRVDAGAQYTC